MSPPRLPYGRQTIDESDIAAVVEALRSDLITTGPRVEAFEEALCEVTGARYAVAVSSGTAALHAAYAALGIGPAQDVVVPALTFAATANAALYVGARPVFADIEPETGTLSAESAAAAITRRTAAVVAVDYAGHPADYAALRDLARASGLPLIADAAHSLGAKDRGQAVGMLADVTTLSFHPVKHITTGEGGAVLTDDEGIAQYARDFRTHGIVRDRRRLRRDDGPWHSEMHALGFNYRITDIQCALGLSQLEKLPQFLARRRAIAERYQAELTDVPGISVPVVRDGVEASWHLYVVRVTRPDRRRAVFDAIQEAGLGVQVHYLPVYRHPYYQDLGYPDDRCPNAEDFYARAVSLPIYPTLATADVDYVIEQVRTIAARLLQ